MDHHHEPHSGSSNFIQDLVIGLSDGLTVPFALAAGVSGAIGAGIHGNSLVITAGLAEIAAGSIAMGLGGFLAGQTSIEHYDSELKREYEEVARVPEIEKQEVMDIFATYGIKESTQKIIVEELSADTDKWVEFMMRYELGLEKPEANRATISALTIGLAYIGGGIVPLLPYFFTNTPIHGLEFSAVVTVICLFLFGYYKAYMTGQKPIPGAIKMTLIGALAAGAAFLIARLISPVA
jgi:VIT1/CCC1 family predicted Fe2+/Mn2+ transporter